MSYDIIVIGGGIAGVSVAAELSGEATVLLLEAERSLAYHASGRSAAMFLPFYGNRIVRNLNEASADHHMNADGGVLRPRPFLSVAPEAKTDHLDRATAELGLTPMAPEDALKLLPILDADWLVAAATTNQAWELDTDLLIQNYRRRLLANGGQIETAARVDGMTRTDGTWHVSWQGGDARAPEVVNAAGAWADPVAAMAGLAPLGLQPHRRSMAQLAAPGERDVTDWPFVEEVDESWYARPDAGRWIVSPADEDPVDPGDAWADDMVLAEGLARYQDAVTVEVTKPLTSWAGLRTIAPDRTLVVGPDPRMAGVWWSAGQAGYGFQTAPAVSRLLAAQMQGRTPDLDSETVTALGVERLI